MKTIALSKGYVTQVDDEDYGWLSKIKWHVKAYNERKIYASGWIKENGKWRHVLMHRLIMDVTDPKIQVDHRSGDGLNNQRHNLRLATNAQNSCNQRLSRANTSGYRGVHWDKRSKNGGLS